MIVASQTNCILSRPRREKRGEERKKENKQEVGKRPNSSRRENVAREQKNRMEPFWIFPCKARKTVKNVYMNQGKYDSES